MIQEDIDSFVKKYNEIKKTTSLTKQHEDQLLQIVTGLIGLYALRRKKELAALIEEMLTFADKQNWGLQGARIEFENIKKGKLKIKK